MAYTDLIKIDRPLGTELSLIAYLNAKAYAGETVEIYVYIKNQHSSAIGVKPRAIINGTIEAVFTVPYTNIPAGYTYYFTGRFTMPNVDANIRAESYYYGADGQWHFEDYQTRTVNLAAVAEIPKASIISKVLEYSGLSVSLPAPGVTQGVSAKLRVGVRNDSATNQELAIAWTIVDPDYVVVQAYRNTEYFWTGPGNTQQFVGGSFTLSKIGTYWVRIQAFAKTDLVNPIDDTGAISLCTTVVQTIPTGLRSMGINVTYGTYDYGAVIPYVLGYDYKGEAQSGTLKVEIGTGVYPYFTPVAVIGPVSYNFAKKTDYTRVTENETFILPSTLVRGQTYSVKATLATADGVSDNDVDYTALKVLDTTVPTTDLQAMSISTQYRDYALGETLPFSVTVKYKGIAQGGTLQAFIKKGLALVYTYPPSAVRFDRVDTLTTITSESSIILPRTLEPGQVYSLRLEMATADGKTTSETKGSAFKIASGQVPEDPGVGEYREVKDYIYPYAETYRGPCTEATVEITIPLAQLPGTDWLSERVVDEFEKGVTENGAHMLQIVVHERERGLTSKDYMLIARATKPKEVAGQAYTPQGIISLAYVTPQLGPAIWALIILGVLVALGFIISAVVPKVREGVWGEGGLVETVTGIGGLLGEILPMMMIMVMMTLMMEQTRELYEPPPGYEMVKAKREAAVLAQRDWNKARALVASKKTELRVAPEELKAEKEAELRDAERYEAGSHRVFEEAKAELDRARAEQAKMPPPPPRPKPVTEAATKVAKWVGREAVEWAEKGWEEAKKLVAEARKEWKEASEERKAEKAEELRIAEEREAEGRRKLREAKTELRKRRAEKSEQ